MFDSIFPKHWTTLQRLMWLKTNALARAVYEIVTGNPVTFNAKAAPLRQLKVAFSPQQDLHGYDSPWPAGGGKNKFDLNANNIYRKNGETDWTYAIANGTLTVVVTAQASNWMRFKMFEITQDMVGQKYVQSYTENPVVNGRWFTLVDVDAGTDSVVYSNPITITQDMVGKWLGIHIKFQTVGTFTFSNIQVEQGSSATSFAPYSNICPISGWDSLTVEQRGKNLFNPSANVNSTFTSSIADALAHFKTTGEYAKGYVSGGGVLLINPEYITTFTPIKSGEEYSIKNADPALNFSSIIFLDDDGNIISRSPSWSNAKYTHTALPNEKYIMCGVRIPDDIKTAMIVIGDTMPAAYVPYNPSSRSISINIGSTVYSGELDVLNGVLRVDYVKRTNIVFAGFFEGYNPYKQFYFVDGTLTRTGTEAAKMKSNLLSYATPLDSAPLWSYGTERGGVNTMICILPFDTIAEANTWASENGLECMFKLAEPLTIQLTPQEVQSLAGDNTMWSNANQPITVEYRKN